MDEEEHWHRHMAIDVDGSMYCTLEAARAMVDAGTPGAIIVTTLTNGFFVEETHTPYDTTKGALLTFIRSAAIELGRYSVRVNGVAPGVVDTPIAALVVHNPELAPEHLKSIPLGRFGQPSDVAKAVAWLGLRAIVLTGHTIVIDGNQTLGILGNLGLPRRRRASDTMLAQCSRPVMGNPGCRTGTAPRRPRPGAAVRSRHPRWSPTRVSSSAAGWRSLLART